MGKQEVLTGVAENSEALILLFFIFVFLKGLNLKAGDAIDQARSIVVIQQSNEC